MRWNTPNRSQVQYCAKVGIASTAGYLLCVGDARQYGVYAAFSAALIVGSSVGEDIGTSANRVRGTLAGLCAGLAIAVTLGSNAVSLGLGVALTALLSLGFGWGVSAARVGASLAAVTILLHGFDALRYSGMRAVNTLIGIAVGLAVSVVVLPVRGRAVIEDSVRATLLAAANLLDWVAAGGTSEARPLRFALLDAITALQKAVADERREDILRPGAELRDEKRWRPMGRASIAAMAASFAWSSAERASEPADLDRVRKEAASLAERLRRTAGESRAPSAAQLAPEQGTAQAGSSGAAPDGERALQGLLHNLREISAALDEFERQA